MRLRCLLPLALLLLLPASTANGDGFPPVDLAAGPDGVVGPNGGFRFGALPTSGGTVLTKTSTRGGQVLRAGVLEGSWGVPARHAWNSRLAIRGARIQVIYRDRVIASAARRPQEASTGGGPPWAVALLLASGLIAAAGARRVAASRSGHPRR